MAEFKRSRIINKDDENVTKKTVILGVLTILMFLFVAIFGLPILIKFSILLGDLRSRNSKEVKEKVLPPMPPRIVLPLEATNSSRLSVGGFGEKGTMIELLKNDLSVGKMDVSETGDFSFNDIMLDMGDNVFSAIALSADRGSSEPSKQVTIVYDNQAPSLEMSNPKEDKLTIDYADYDIIGKSEKGVSVTMNGRLAVVADDGTFKLKFQLNAGKNEIEVVVKDKAGNETKKKIEITYDI